MCQLCGSSMYPWFVLALDAHMQRTVACHAVGPALAESSLTQFVSLESSDLLHTHLALDGSV